ncbi:hypothetical protein HRbin40_01044 [bacterium HR40]|nr:hypothetical protein HRbin40_01044 [bacterium HR40]
MERCNRPPRVRCLALPPPAPRRRGRGSCWMQAGWRGHPCRRIDRSSGAARGASRLRWRRPARGWHPRAARGRSTALASMRRTPLVCAKGVRDAVLALPGPIACYGGTARGIGSARSSPSCRRCSRAGWQDRSSPRTAPQGRRVGPASCAKRAQLARLPFARSCRRSRGSGADRRFLEGGRACAAGVRDERPDVANGLRLRYLCKASQWRLGVRPVVRSHGHSPHGRGTYRTVHLGGVLHPCCAVGGVAAEVAPLAPRREPGASRPKAFSVPNFGSRARRLWVPSATRFSTSRPRHRWSAARAERWTGREVYDACRSLPPRKDRSAERRRTSRRCDRSGSLSRRLYANALPRAEARVWRGHPIRVLYGDRVSHRPECRARPVRRQCRGEQSSDRPGRRREGTLEAAGGRFGYPERSDGLLLRRWFAKAGQRADPRSRSRHRQAPKRAVVPATKRRAE